ncbi:PREDICTED: uncharacterized protein LOC104605748 [Nelumbo nucifera]|uniref:Uncharacterized protein LOC104605748 n=1 Tax=Nelumbo nucifera TaxID=4432 RepID=A0A1U8AM85_NELNU|nr:PREDICTED: uncharacterized protein LOC104605748 [Nelumbo nucifera]
MSEICSLSESVSTTTMTERKDDDERSRDDGEVRQRVDRSPARVPRKRLVSGDYAGKTEKGGRSPARRYEPSPGRKMDNATMSVHSKEMSHSTRRRVPANNGLIRRDPGDSSGRRSRSPATRSVDPGSYRSTIGRSPSSRKTGRSPGQAPPLSEDNGRKLEETKEGSWQTNESLENPLVSLECFIFL